MKLFISLVCAIFLFVSLSSRVYAAVQGDTNSDSQVDGEDYVIWLGNYGEETQAGAVEGDLNNDKVVDGLDYIIWLLSFNSNPSQPLPTLEPTPEATVSPTPDLSPTPEATIVPTQAAEDPAPLETPTPAQ